MCVRDADDGRAYMVKRGETSHLTSRIVEGLGSGVLADLVSHCLFGRFAPFGKLPFLIVLERSTTLEHWPREPFPDSLVEKGEPPETSCSATVADDPDPRSSGSAAEALVARVLPVCRASEG